MYKPGFLILALFLLPVQQSGSQTLDQILSRHYEASGQEVFDRVGTVRSTGRAVQMGMELPFIQIQKRPDKMYLEIDIGGEKMVQVFDGEKGWAVEPWTDPEPRDLTGQELRSAGQMAGVDSDLVDWQEKGYHVEFMGEESLQGTNTYGIRLVKEGGETYQFFLDSDSYLIIRIVTHTDHDGTVTAGETILSDYRVVNGVRVPFRSELRYGGQTLMTNILHRVEFDVVIEEKIFTRPR